MFPSLAQLNRCDALLRILKNVGLNEILELVFTNKALQEVKELEALFIGDGGKGVVRAVSLEDRVDARVSAIKAIGVHVSP